VGVIGSPIAHSLSPLLHRAAFASLGLPWESLAFEVPAGQAAGALADMRRFEVAGLSVTMPHKADVAGLVDECSPVATRLGAVNCVVNRAGVLRGENTDGAGFVASLARGAGFDPAGARCVVIGAGGAARAVVLALAEGGAADVAVLNRTPARAAAAAALAGPVGRVADAGDVGAVAAAVAQADLVVNATPVGMAGAGDAGSDREGVRKGDREGVRGWPIDPGLLRRGQVVADLIYVPRPTPWLEAAAEMGAEAVDGLGMLVHQAAVQVELWTEIPAPVEDMWNAALHGV
jgi:shikimate dehydrogenase